MIQVMQLERSVDAPPEALWDAIATPRGMARWQADEVRGSVERGGALVLAWPALGARVDLRVVDVAPRERLVVENGDARLAFEIAAGSIRLAHDGLSDGDQREGVAASWRTSLALLAQSVERHRERDRDVSWWIRRVRTTAATAHTFFTEAAAIGSWLVRRGSVGPEGARYAAELWSGAPMSGRVLAHTPGRDVALEWTEQGDSVLVLRTLPSPTDPDERIVALCWSRWSAVPAPEAVCGELSNAADRLARRLGGNATA